MAFKSWLRKRRRGSAPKDILPQGSHVPIPATQNDSGFVAPGTTSDGGERQPLLSAEVDANGSASEDEPLPAYQAEDPLPITSYEDAA